MKDVVKEQLAGTQHYHTLVLADPSVDITDLDTMKGPMEHHSVTVIDSSHSMIGTAEYAI